MDARFDEQFHNPKYFTKYHGVAISTQDALGIALGLDSEVIKAANFNTMQDYADVFIVKQFEGSKMELSEFTDDTLQ